MHGSVKPLIVELGFASIWPKTFVMLYKNLVFRSFLRSLDQVLRRLEIINISDAWNAEFLRFKKEAAI